MLRTACRRALGRLPRPCHRSSTRVETYSPVVIKYSRELSRPLTSHVAPLPPTSCLSKRRSNNDGHRQGNSGGNKTPSSSLWGLAPVVFASAFAESEESHAKERHTGIAFSPTTTTWFCHNDACEQRSVHLVDVGARAMSNMYWLPYALAYAVGLYESSPSHESKNSASYDMPGYGEFENKYLGPNSDKSLVLKFCSSHRGSHIAKGFKKYDSKIVIPLTFLYLY